MKIILEVVRGLFILSVTALFVALLFTGYWLFQRYNWNSQANGTTYASFAQAYSQLGMTSWLYAHAWVFIDIGLVLLTAVLGWGWRYCVKRNNRSR